MNDVPDRQTFEDEEDRRLSALLRATHARANPAVWQRVRAELAPTVRPAKSGGFDAVLAWFTRPAALAAATLALVVSLGAGYGLLGSVAPIGETDTALATEPLSLMESLLDETAATTTGDELDDAPADSGGES